MKNNNYLILFLGLLALTSFGARAAQITHTVTYDPSKLSITYDTINGMPYVKVIYGDLPSFDIEGSPELPNDNILFSVPYNATNYSVSLDIKNSCDIQVGAMVYPSQLPRELNDTSKVAFTQPNMEIYGQSSFYPIEQARVVSHGFLLGDNNVVTILLQPVSYNPITNIINLITEASITLSYQIDDNYIPAIYRSNNEIKKYEQSVVMQNVINASSVASNSYTPPQVMSMMREGHTSLPSYEYCIITNQALEPAFKKIIAMKRQKGISAGTVCIEDLMASNYNDGDINLDEFGDTISVIADSAGVVRQYLKYAFSNHTTSTKYLLMGGKAPFAPTRFAKSYPNTYPTHKHVPTDMYFSDLTMPWIYINSDFDNVFQSEYIVPNVDYSNEALPYNPDIFVGRLLCSNQEEIDNYSNKLHTYVFNPGKEDISYLSRTLVVSSNLLRSMANRFINNTNSLLNITHIDNMESNYLTGAQHIDRINQIKYGYVSLYGHGEPQSIEVFNNGTIRHVISALDRYLPDTIGSTTETTINENGNGLDNLTNKHYPFVCYSISCVTMPFDTVKYDFNVFTTYERDYNFGQSFTLGKNYGGPAYLGNTRMGYPGYSEYLEAEFMKYLLNKQIYSIGKAEAFSKMTYKYGSRFSNHIILEHNLLGDPEFEMWTSEPSQYSGIFVSRLDNGFRISGTSITDTIAFCDNYGHQGTVVGNGNNSMFISAHRSSTLMVFNHNHIPYIAPMMLQNCEISNSQYVYASSFRAGKSILPNNTHGNVTIKNGAEYEIEATDDVYLGEGFIVENGATFAIKTPGKVTIDGCVFQSGARVKIEAGNVEIAGKFTAVKGSKVEFNQYVDE